MELNIRSAKNRIRKLENDLDVYLTKKKINFTKTQPKSPKLDSLGISKTNEIFDKFTHYVIKDEELDTTIYAVQEEIASLQNYIVKEMERISKSGGSELVVYLRDEEKLKWDKIAKITHYSERQARRIYNEAKN